MGTMLSVSHGTHILLLDDAHVLLCWLGGQLHGHCMWDGWGHILVIT